MSEPAKIGSSDEHHHEESEECHSGINAFESKDAASFAQTACFIKCSQVADGCVPARPNRQQYEQQLVIRWSKNGKIPFISDEYLEALPILSNSTSEHEVRFRASDGRVIKKTWPGFYGQIPAIKDGHFDREIATPSEYLERQALQNEVFASDIRMEGINISKKAPMIIGAKSGEPSFVVTQKFYEAANPHNPSPTRQQISDFLNEHGFRRVDGSYFGWFREIDGVAIVDAKEDNFILTSEGVIPIDLQMSRLDDFKNNSKVSEA